MNPTSRHLIDAVSSPGVDVLHVEDDDEYAELVKMWVTGRGLAMHRVRSRKELLSYLAVCAPPPRCLLLDMSLEDSHGLSLCDELKRSPALQQLPIVLLSAANLTACECQEHGALQLVRKGSEGEPELLAALTAVIAQHDRSRGIATCGDLRLDPRDRSVMVAGKLAVQLTQGAFNGLLLLVKSAPDCVTDIDLYMAFMERGAYHHNDDPELTVKSVVIGIGAAGISPGRPLPHHRTCGSASGG
ncbi:MAG: response regulator [Elusimicrobia bacterium]|nr:response regulator [Elusimicrobiota bacterium]